MWVVSYHLSAKVCTRMALADLSNSKRMIGSKLVAQMRAFVSVVRTLYHATTLLVLPLLENEGETYKKMKRSC